MYNSSHAHHAQGNKSPILKSYMVVRRNWQISYVLPPEIVPFQSLCYSLCLLGMTRKCHRLSPTRAATSAMATVLAQHDVHQCHSEDAA